MHGSDPSFCRDVSQHLRGETYDPDKLKDLYRKLYLTGLYDTLDIQEVPQADDTIQLVASPVEAKAKELGFYGGYDTFDGVLFGANYTNRNIDGLGRIFSFSRIIRVAARTARFPTKTPGFSKAILIYRSGARCFRSKIWSGTRFRTTTHDSD